MAEVTTHMPNIYKNDSENVAKLKASSNLTAIQGTRIMDFGLGSFSHSMNNNYYNIIPFNHEMNILLWVIGPI